MSSFSRLASCLFLGLLLILAACATVTPPAQPPGHTPEPIEKTLAADPPTTSVAQPTLTTFPEPASQLPQDTVTLLPSLTSPVPLICSPLEGISIEELTQPDLLKNPFQQPRPGMDDGHHGIDFAYWSRGERKTMLGLPVLSAMDGRIAGIIDNSQPYGYTIIIETSLDEIPAGINQKIPFPTQAPTVEPAPNLYCPKIDSSKPVSTERSLYLLYAHLNKKPTGSIGQQVRCGQAIGEVGTSGKSVNPHLHFEARIGPSGIIFPAMAHYENDATTEEMHAYCTWRVSGLFQMFDPLILLQIDSLQP